MTDKYKAIEDKINKLINLAEPELKNVEPGHPVDKLNCSKAMISILRLRLELADIMLTLRDIKIESMDAKLNKFMCVICMTNLRDCLLEPCSHFACCEECIKQLTGLSCPVCRQSCEYYLKVFTI